MVSPRSVRVFAPAKINLTLHVTGQRDDGYHLLDSLVTFASVGDVLTATLGAGEGLTVSGPFAGQVPTDDTNFIHKVVSHFQFEAPLSFHLEKNLPVASGIGGGSADAGACIRALVALNGGQGALSVAEMMKIGADLPMCVAAQPARVRGVGEILEPRQALPELHLVLVNPGVAVSTPEVFAALASRQNAPMTPMPDGPDRFGQWLAAQRNDLQDAAIGIAPEIARVLDALRSIPGCRLARMSGSGASCFGIFDTVQNAALAADHLSRAQPHWWVAAGDSNGSGRAAPQLMRSTT